MNTKPPPTRKLYVFKIILSYGEYAVGVVTEDKDIAQIMAEDEMWLRILEVELKYEVIVPEFTDHSGVAFIIGYAE
jgi:hypothetical protein